MAMSFQLTVTAQGGELAVSHSGTVPPGAYEITGHEDEHARTLALVQRGPDGRYVSQVSHVHHKEA